MTMTVLKERDRLGVRPGRLFIDGAWADATDGATFDQVNPATNEVVTTFALGTVADVDRAVRAARVAFDEGPWPRLHAKDRKAILGRLVELITRNGDELNRLQTLENGMPIAFSSMSVVSSAMAAAVFDHHAGWIDKICGQTYPCYEASPTGADVQVLSFREPVGVVAAVIPWNAPMMLFAQKVAPALATGCTVVLKPSEFAVLTSIRLTELIEEAGVPPGVFNLVTGTGDPTGETLVTHPGVDKVTFTGSRAVGQRILAASGNGIKRVTLELGGKSPSIIFDDATSVSGAAMMAMGMVSMGISGQGCVCQTRSLVQRNVYDEFVESAAGLASHGDLRRPLRPGDDLGGDHQPAPARPDPRVHRAGARGGARLVVGRGPSGRRPGPGELRQPDPVRRRRQHHVGDQRGGLRTGAGGHALRRRGRGDPSGQRHRLRAGCGRLHDQHRPGDCGWPRRSGPAPWASTSTRSCPTPRSAGYKSSGLGREGGWGSIEAFTEVKSVIVGPPGERGPMSGAGHRVVAR